MTRHRHLMLRACALPSLLGLALLCGTATAGNPMPLRTGTFYGTWQDPAEFKIDQLDAAARQFSGTATLTEGANKGYVIRFSGKIAADDSVSLTRTDEWAGKVIRQFANAGAPRVVDTMTTWSGQVTGPDSGEGFMPFVLRIPLLWREQAHLTDPNAGRPGERFGTWVCMSGDTLAVSSRPEDRYDSRVWVVSAADGTFRGQSMLKSEDAGEGVAFRGAIALSGNKLVATAERQNVAMVCTYVRDGTTWGAQRVTVGGKDSVRTGFGAGLAISSDTVAITAPYEKESQDAPHHGGVHVYDGPTPQAHLTPSDEGAPYKTAVALSGDTLVVAAGGTALAYVYVRKGTTWSEQAILNTASPKDPNHQYGSALALSGDTLVIGASSEDEGAGAVYVFQRSGTTWTRQARIQHPDSTRLGQSVALSGDTIVAGNGRSANSEGRNSPPGYAVVYKRSGTNWSEESVLRGLTNPEHATRDWFGVSLALHNDTIAVGASGERGYGAVHIYR